MKVLFESSAAEFVKAVETCSECACDIKKRPALNSIKFSRREDNFILCESIDAISYVKSLMEVDPNKLDKTFNYVVIESDSLLNITKILKADKKTLFQPIQVCEDETTNNIVITTYTCGLFTITKDHIHNEEYPNLDHCCGDIMKRTNTFSVGVAIDNLEKMIKIAKHNKAHHVILKFIDNNEKPVVFETTDAQGCIVPLKSR